MGESVVEGYPPAAAVVLPCRGASLRVERGVELRRLVGANDEGRSWA